MAEKDFPGRKRAYINFDRHKQQAAAAESALINPTAPYDPYLPAAGSEDNNQPQPGERILVYSLMNREYPLPQWKQVLGSVKLEKE